MRSPASRLPELPPSFTVREGRQRGLTEWRLRDPSLRRSFHGARSLGADGGDAADDPEPWWQTRSREAEQALCDYLPVMPVHAFFCGPTAARHWGIPLPRRLDATLHVGVWRPRSAPVRPGIRGHQFSGGFVRTVVSEGIRVTDPASTWASMGALLTDDELVAAADAVLHIPRHPGRFAPVRETALATRAELAGFAERKGRPGAPALRRALVLARTGAASPPETQIRLILHDVRMPEPVLDYDVYDARGLFLGCSELAYPESKLAIEYESDGHLTRAQLQRDIDKYQAYAEAGWAVVRLTSAHVYRAPREAVRRVRAGLAAAAARL
ncbi:hypothetical protein [uncultured Microbacterium sp.]|uniref:hypothetical protein n=1 Tax=uncultured Microbacterium sp. TaxID=191216 RepID=UPI0025DAF0A4|nr:hypothetical protein [uncultured Microbacterium sp.]